MQNNKEKCNDCVIALYKCRNVLKSQSELLKLIPWYDLDKLEKFSKCPICNFPIT